MDKKLKITQTKELIDMITDEIKRDPFCTTYAHKHNTLLLEDMAISLAIIADCMLKDS